jgi:hypothetical protein
MGLSNFDSWKGLTAQHRFLPDALRIRSFRNMPTDPTFSTAC